MTAKNKIFGLAVLLILLVSMASVASAAATTKCPKVNPIEPGILDVDKDKKGVIVFIRMGNPAGTTQSDLCYRVGNGPWIKIDWAKKYKFNEIVPYRIPNSKCAKHNWNIEIARNKKVNGKYISAENIFY